MFHWVVVYLQLKKKTTIKHIKSVKKEVDLYLIFYFCFTSIKKALKYLIWNNQTNKEKKTRLF